MASQPPLKRAKHENTWGWDNCDQHSVPAQALALHIHTLIQNKDESDIQEVQQNISDYRNNIWQLNSFGPGEAANHQARFNAVLSEVPYESLCVIENLFTPLYIPNMAVLLQTSEY